MDNARKQRGVTQKLFLVEACKVEGEMERKYVIMGSTGNIYTVSIKDNSSCTCPDYKRRYKTCKHIFFVLLKIMKVPEESINSNKFKVDELKTMFLNIPAVTSALCVDNKLRDRYVKVVSGDSGDKDGKYTGDTDDACPICLDDIDNGEAYDHCKNGCNKCVHVLCFSMWCKKNNSLCVFCRKEWNKKTDGDYVNLL